LRRSVIPIEIFRCPACGASVRSEGETLACDGGHRYPVENGVPDFAGGDPNADAWSLKWEVERRLGAFYRRPPMSEILSEIWEDCLAYCHLFQGRLDGLRILEAGCGAGHFSARLAQRGAEVIGMDLSRAAFAAAAWYRDVPNLSFARGNILSPPFAAQTFDRVVSVGVLHHTGKTAEAFAALAPLVKKGGHLSVWIYARSKGFDLRLRIVHLWRNLISRLPGSIQVFVGLAAVPLYYLYQFPVLGKIGYRIFGISMWPYWQARVIETIDLYAPRHMDAHTSEEVRSWFREAGYEIVAESHWPVGITGRRIA
jgi:SAM-dependent methyltransferase